jgi:Mg-chelatase subunit ChlD
MDTHVTFVLDSSGSMQSIEADTRGGFNSFLTDQRSEEGEATVTLVDFDTTVDVTYQARSIEDAPELTESTYTPSGQTALHDAIITAIEQADARFDEMDGEQPENVIIVVLTDGKENASETPKATVRKMVEARQEDEWEFLFIGANQDAALTAGKIGVDKDRTLDMDASSEGTQAAYDSASERISNARAQGTTGGFTDEDRSRQENADE